MSLLYSFLSEWFFVAGGEGNLLNFNSSAAWVSLELTRVDIQILMYDLRKTYWHKKIIRLWNDSLWKMKRIMQHVLNV
jgi:hypothetical protein